MDRTAEHTPPDRPATTQPGGTPAPHSESNRAAPLPSEGRQRVVIESVSPEIDAGRFPTKAVIGDWVTVEADIFADGHDRVAGALQYRRAGSDSWQRQPMESIGNDRWRGRFRAQALGVYEFTVSGWIDRFATWRHDIRAKVEAGQDVELDLKEGAALVEAAAERAAGDDADALREFAGRLSSPRPALDPALASLMARHPDRSRATRYPRVLSVNVDRERAAFGAWYELFPRSCGAGTTHGTFADSARQLPRLAKLGFDVLYLPPIHPIGESYRKGPNNSLKAEPGDPGSPWAIGGKAGGHNAGGQKAGGEKAGSHNVGSENAGGHTAIHPDLGTLDDFRELVRAARNHGLEVALDLAFQCSPDHPWVEAHPEWFKRRPDGSIKHAENPPKKYEDIVPLDFESDDWEGLWRELESVVRHWVEQGVRIFRVDNPHTKTFNFWEWLIASIRADYPDVFFLSEAFTRPKVMHRLAKLGFAQSYTYFTWRNTAWELRTYFNELTTPPVIDFMRPNLWPNTPDILPEFLQTGDRRAFRIRFILAATLGANYGLYGPAFEVLASEPREPGSEEYLNSEKYEIKDWDLAEAKPLEDLMAKVNRIRREHKALQRDRSLTFHATDSDMLLAYSKTDGGEQSPTDVILTVVNLDPHHRHTAWLDLDLGALGVPLDEPFQAHDLLADEGYLWQGPRNYVALDPGNAHIFRVRRHVRTESDFEYYL